MQRVLYSLSFDLIDWQGFSFGAHTQEDWLVWAIEQQWPQTEVMVFDAIPPMSRRRMSVLSKYAVQTALTLLARNEVDYLVFASRHGELHRTAQLLSSILRHEPASPMAFSQSVHNTAAGLSTIISKQALPLTSISAGHHTFHSAIVESYAYLCDHPTHKVMLIDFDQMLPELYRDFETQSYPDYAVGMVITAGEHYQIKVVEGCGDVHEAQAMLPTSLHCFKALLSNQSHWTVPSEQGTCWQWSQK